MGLRPVARPNSQVGAAAGCLLLLAVGCGGERQDSRAPEVAPAQTARGALLLPEAHPEYIQAGAPRRFPELRNPYQDSAGVVAQGEQLFISFNCNGCHGSGAAGLVAPSLADGRWRYGGSPAAMFQSIYEGRPLGMPAFGTLLTEDLIWRIVAYIQSLEAASASAASEGAP